MRLHELTMTAFGPFAGTVTVDFDALAEGGLFLLTGATGAGKTSVLDAVCFGLYGEVPGDRAAAKHLRSDHADPALAPEVVLRLSIGARTFRFTRSPAWQRSKRRGNGTTRVPAHVVVEEQRGETWVSLTHRLDEAGDLVGRLLGMTCTQFTQVAMLPQGRFQAFLRASSEERHTVLQRLFRTRRFEDVEHWLIDHRLGLRRDSQLAQERTAAVVNRVQEAGGQPAPEDWDPHDLSEPAEAGEVDAWHREVLAVVAADADDARGALVTADAEVGRGTDDLARARSVHDAKVRVAAARAVLDEAVRQEPELAVLRHRAERHALAGPVVSLARRSRQAEMALAAVERELLPCLAQVSPLSTSEAGSEAGSGTVPGTGTEQQLDALLAETGRRQVLAERALPQEAELARWRVAYDDALATAGGLRALAESGTALRDALPGRIARTRARLLETRLQAADADSAGLELARAETALTAAARAQDLDNRLVLARAEHVALVDAAQQRHEHYLHVRETRINQMASELAVSLTVGCSCPVCGSPEHPAPAAAPSGGGGRELEEDARRSFEEAGFARQTSEEELRTLQTQLASASTACEGRSPAVVRQQIHGLRQRVERSAHSAALVPALSRSLAADEARLLEIDQEITEATSGIAAADAAADQASARVRELARELDGLLEGTGTSSIRELTQQLATSLRLLERARLLLRRHRDVSVSAHDARESAGEAARAAGFDDVAQARSAILPAADLATGAARLETAQRTRVAAESTLADEDLGRLAAAPVSDLDSLTTALAGAQERRDRAGAALDAAGARVSRLTALGAELEAELGRWAPVRHAYAVAGALAAFAEGKGPDNPQRMRLSAYVLSERLRQVVAAANERLSAMSGGRYALEHTDQRGAGEQRGGLSLLVLDEWSGVRRDPATLSGGETFVVSLALALGLADTVSHEAGGTDIDTLFIDEGFGSLDSATLEDVMDTLDGLRQGGRVVGLVSHVAELRTRVTTQLEVRKGRSGSEVRLVRADG